MAIYKSKTVTKDIIETTFEVELKDNHTEILDKFKNVEGIISASVISYQNDFGA